MADIDGGCGCIADVVEAVILRITRWNDYYIRRTELKLIVKVEAVDC